MTDTVSPEVRSRIMASVKGKDTKPEMIIRKMLHALGFRYRLHVKNLPGCPDIVLPKYKAVIMVNGCFWHGHECRKAKFPETRTSFWRDKIEKNRARDKDNINALEQKGWRTFVIWECQVNDEKARKELLEFLRP